MNMIDQIDKEKLEEARQLIWEVQDYNYLSDSDPLFKKLGTIICKIDKIIEKHCKSK